MLICVFGRGWYQEWGKPARELHAGDVVNIPANVKHWHGAAADGWFQHIASRLRARMVGTSGSSPFPTRSTPSSASLIA
jgi:4-carboxymuconolactone decarboxylase